MRKNVVLTMLLLIFTASYVYSEGFISVNDAPGTPDPKTLYKENIISAWANFDGSTCTGGGAVDECPIRDSFNVDKIKKVSTGQYDVYFKTAVNNINYAALASSNGVTSNTNSDTGTAEFGTDKYRIYVTYSNAWHDTNLISTMVIGGN